MPARLPNPIAVVSADTDQAALIARLHGESFARPSGEAAAVRLWSAAECEALLAQASGFAFLGLRRRLVGASQAQGFAVLRGAADEAELLSIGVAPPARGSGLGAALMTALLDAAPRRGVRRLFLEVDTANAPALALYKRFGFVEAGRRSSYYAPGADALTLRRDI